MTYQNVNLNYVQNITNGERSLRIIVGATLIAGIFIHSVTANAIAALATLAMYPICTAIMGWDPLYAAYAQARNQARTLATLATYPRANRNRAQPNRPEHKQAA